MRCSEVAPAQSSLLTPISPRSCPVSVRSLMRARSRWTSGRICVEIIAYSSFLVFLHKTEFLSPLCGNMLSGSTQLPPTAHRFISYRMSHSVLEWPGPQGIGICNSSIYYLCKFNTESHRHSLKPHHKLMTEDTQRRWGRSE